MTAFDYLNFPEVFRNINAGDLQPIFARAAKAGNCAISIIDPITKEEV